MPAKIPVKIMMEEGCDDLLPAKAHSDDAAWDLRSRVKMSVPPGKIALVPTGVFLELPYGVEAQVRPRSGLALKHSIGVLNSPGTIDAGYRGEVGVILFNAGENEFAIERGDRIAQMVIATLPEVDMQLVKELSPSGRGGGGFGPTGKK